jgi:hypothetical protein
VTAMQAVALAGACGRRRAKPCSWCGAAWAASSVRSRSTWRSWRARGRGDLFLAPYDTVYASSPSRRRREQVDDPVHQGQHPRIAPADGARGGARVMRALPSSLLLIAAALLAGCGAARAPLPTAPRASRSASAASSRATSWRSASR